jgi:phosphoserine aminotransferase
VFASGGKNVPAGMTLVIVREDLLDLPVHPHCPAILDYRENGGGKAVPSVFESMPNTPPVFATWMLELMLDHVGPDGLGGLAAVEARMAARTDRLYAEIDASDG